MMEVFVFAVFVAGAILLASWVVLREQNNIPPPPPQLLKPLPPCYLEPPEFRQQEEQRVKERIDLEYRKHGIFPQDEIDAMKCKLKNGEPLDKDKVLLMCPVCGELAVVMWNCEEAKAFANCGCFTVKADHISGAIICLKNKQDEMMKWRK